MGKRERTVSEYITEALLALMQERKYSGISVSDITARAGVSRASFYRNFTSREDILTSYLDRITDEFIRESRINYKEDAMERYISCWLKNGCVETPDELSAILSDLLSR